MVKIILFSILVVISVLSQFSLASNNNVDWWEDASFYQIYPRSWKDSDGNGIGDLNGITEKLDYLKEIGITATWLSPIFESPMVDNGYDISNFTRIEPLFGTMDDFDALVRKAKSIGVKVILDFVPNHSSDECEWFRKSVNREDGYDDFYVWADGKDDPKNPGKKLPPSNWLSVFEGSMWEWNEKRQQFYLHQFFKQQPEFNFRSPKVHKVMLEVLKFWLDKGVDGFRIDAVPHMYERMFENGTYPDEKLSGNSDNPNSQYYLEHKHTQEQYETVELLYEWREFLDEYKRKNGGDTRILLAEAYASMKSIRQYFGNGTHYGAHLPFNFNMMSVREFSNARDFETYAKNWTDVMWKTHKMANWVNGNHDIPRLSTRVGKDKNDLVNVLTAALPGATVTYYGEEIGMANSAIVCPNCYEGEERKFVRSPFQWNDGVSAGFSTSNNTWLPVADNYKKVNVKLQRGVARSSLNVFKNVHRHKHTAAFKAFKNDGGFSFGAVTDNVFQIIRGNSTAEYRILANFGKKVEHVGKLLDSSRSRKNIYEYTLVTDYSPHNIGERVKLSDVTIMPSEAVILRKLIKK
ncbi:maltase A2-like [Episyrphus balteatus]|uniref:maltase A2-like n=1 Tax=Episyrphus balteatus TaxID=286459 RepID=UPI002485F3C3|nr:maltase A2-like [Episyrphus balteatus]